MGRSCSVDPTSRVMPALRIPVAYSPVRGSASKAARSRRLTNAGGARLIGAPGQVSYAAACARLWSFCASYSRVAISKAIAMRSAASAIFCAV